MLSSFELWDYVYGAMQVAMQLVMVMRCGLYSSREIFGNTKWGVTVVPLSDNKPHFKDTARLS